MSVIIKGFGTNPLTKGFGTSFIGKLIIEVMRLKSPISRLLRLDGLWRPKT